MLLKSIEKRNLQLFKKTPVLQTFNKRFFFFNFKTVVMFLVRFFPFENAHVFNAIKQQINAKKRKNNACQTHVKQAFFKRFLIHG
jgi:hypothetical protein